MPRFLYAIDPAGFVRVVAHPPLRCAACQRMASFLINRGGRTRCDLCDAKEGK